MTDPVLSKELTEAIAIANRLLDEPFADPDDDARTVARQFLRGREAIERLQRELARVTGEREPPHCSSCSCGLAPEPRHDVVAVIADEIAASVPADAPSLAERIATALGAADLLWREGEHTTAEPCPRYPHWHCPHHGDFDARVAVGCPECVREMRNQIRAAQPPVDG